MIYFIESSAANFNEDGEIINHFSLYKIGYATDEKWKGRETTYKTENPTRYVHRVIDGATLEDERALHSYLVDKFDRFENGREWYIKSKDLYNYMMNLTLEDIQYLPRSVGESRRADYYKKMTLLPRFFGEFDSSKDFGLGYSELKKNFYDNILDDIGRDVLNEDILNDYLLKRFGEDSFNRYINRDEILKDTINNLTVGEKDIILKSLDVFENTNNFQEQLKTLCTIEDNSLLEKLLLNLDSSNEAVSYFKALGKGVCSGWGYRKTNLSNVMKRQTVQTRENEAIEGAFEVGRKYTSSFIQNTILKIYRDSGLVIKAVKPTEIDNYFKVENTTLTLTDSATGKKKRVRGYKILSKR